MRRKRTFVVLLALTVGGVVVSTIFWSEGDHENVAEDTGRGHAVVEGVREKPSQPLAGQTLPDPTAPKLNVPVERNDFRRIWRLPPPPPLLHENSPPLRSYPWMGDFPKVNPWSLPPQPDHLDPVEPRGLPPLGPRRRQPFESRRFAPDDPIR